MGGMVALAYLGRPPADRPVEPHGLVLAATAAGRLAERGVARLLASPATDMLCGLAARAPQRAVRLLTKPVCATLALQVGDHARSTLKALFDYGLARHGIPRHRRRVPARPAVLRPIPPRSPRSAPRRPSSAAEPTSSPHRPTRATWPPPSPAPHTCTSHGRAHAPPRGPPRRHGCHQPHDRHAHQRPPATYSAGSPSRTTVFSAREDSMNDPNASLHRSTDNLVEQLRSQFETYGDSRTFTFLHESGRTWSRK